ncbi:voltage-gated potassium channel [Dentipellis sp. KUC8613]|nr:voltage-gated potassium channel [Dentipellis sp. KUC8613]
MATSIRLGPLTPQTDFLEERPPSPTSPEDIDDVFVDNSPRHAEPHPDAIRPAWKRELHLLLEHPTSSPSAFLFHVCITTLILVSALVTTLETVPAFHAISGSVWFGLETSMVALFTIEYLARCIAWSYSWSSFLKWFGSFFGILDLLAILPYYIEIALQQDTSTLFRFSILRTFRLLRVFRPFRYSNTLLLTIEVMFLSFRRSQHALLALSFFVMMVVIVFSTLLYFIERGSWDETLGTFINSDGDPSQFASIPAAAWYVIVTITTVGYGEITPRSFPGRLITIPLLVFGLLLIALPSFVLGREFSIVWNEMSSGEVQSISTLPLGSFHSDARDCQMPPTTPYLLPQSPNLMRRRRTPVSSPHASAIDMAPPRDLTNRKLAQNQTELSAQIAALSAVVERQGAMLRALLEREGVGVDITEVVGKDKNGAGPSGLGKRMNGAS